MTPKSENKMFSFLYSCELICLVDERSIHLVITEIDFKVPAKIAVWFLETGRFLPVFIRVPWFLFLVLDVKKVRFV